jgi:WD40 repeat protein/tetratricopeptide (TPR) repeat protein
VNVARSLMAGDFEWASDQDHEKTSPVTVIQAIQDDVPASPALPPSPSDSFTLSSSSVVLPGERRDGSKSKGRRKSYWRSVATIGVQVADALEYAHNQGVQHRDVKPSNLLLDTQATVWVTDFGLAKANDQQNLTHTGDILGTLRYMPPEAFEGMTDARSDIYSLGLTLYEMLAFRPAFDETDRNRLVRQVTCDVPVRLWKLNRQLPQDLETIVHKAIERDASKRYSSAGDLAADLQRFIDDEPIAARPVSPAERTWRWCKRNQAPAAASALAAAGLVAVSLFAVFYALAQARSNRALLAEQRQTRAQRDRAEKLAANLSGALSETKKQEAMLVVEKGQTLIGQGQLYPGMLWLARGLEVAPAEAVSLQHSIRASLAALRGEVLVRHLELPTPDAGRVAFSPDGRTILTAGGREAWLWDAATGQQIGKTWPLGDAFTAMAFSPDSKRVITASANLKAGTGQARLWDARQGSLICDPVSIVGAITSLAFSPDGKTILVATGNYQSSIGEAWFWDAGSLKPRVQLSGYAGLIAAVAYCPDGKTVVIASRNANDGNSDLGFWDTETLNPAGKTIAMNGLVVDMVLTPDAKGIITAHYDQRGGGAVRFWDRATGPQINRPMELNDFIRSVALSPDGRFLATTTENFISKSGEAQLWEMSTAKVVGGPIALSGAFSQVVFSPDGRAILASANLQSPTLWQLPSDRLIGPMFPHQEKVSAIAFSPDGKMIATGTGTLGKKGVAQRWNAATGAPIGPPLPQPGYVLAVTFSRDGKKLATGIGYLGQNKGEARLWDAVTGKPIGSPLPHQNDVNALAFSPDGSMLLTASQDRTACLWNADTGQRIGEALVHPAAVSCVNFSPDGKMVLTSYGKRTRLWEVRSGQPLGKALEHQEPITSVAFSPDGQTFAVACQERLVIVWETATAKPVGFPLDHPDHVTDIAFSPDGKLLLTGCKDHMARIWDARTGLPVGTKLPHPRGVTRVAFSPDGQTVLTGCEDGFARVWDPATVVTGQNSRLVRWVEVESGKELTAECSVRTLDEATLIKRRAALTSLGGPLEGRQGWFSWHLQQAIQCGDNGLWRSAVWHLDRQVADHPQDALAFVLRTRANLELEQPDQADADFARALAVGGIPASVLAGFQAFASAAIEKNRPQRALWYLDRLVRAAPHDAAAWSKKGQIESQQAHWQQASADMTRGVELDGSLYSNWTRALTLNAYSGDVANYHRLRTAAIQRFRDTGEYQIAERIARSCLLVPASAGELGLICELADRSLRLGLESVTRTYIELANGMAAYREGRFSSAIDWLRSTPSLIDRRRELTDKAFLAMAYRRSGQSQKAWQALAEARTLLDHLPQPGGDLVEETQYAGLNEWLASQIAYREAAAILEAPHRRETDSLLGKHEWSNALGLLDVTIAAEPSFWVDWVSRSCARAEMGRQADADADFKRAIELSNGGHNPWLMRGRFYRDLNRPDRAAADFAQALNLIPDSREWERERRLICQDLYGSESIFARLMELRPQDAGLYSTRALISGAKGMGQGHRRFRSSGKVETDRHETVPRARGVPRKSRPPRAGRGRLRSGAAFGSRKSQCLVRGSAGTPGRG